MNSNLTICWETGWLESSAHEEPSYKYEPGSAMGLSVNIFQVSGPASHETTLQNRLFCDLIFLSLKHFQTASGHGKGRGRIIKGLLPWLLRIHGDSVGPQFLFLFYFFYFFFFVGSMLHLASSWLMGRHASCFVLTSTFSVVAFSFSPIGLHTHTYKTPSIGHE